MIAALDAFDEGEVLGPDLLRSGAGAGLVTVLLGLPLGLLALAAGAATGGTLLALLLVTTGTGIALQTLADPFQDALDRLIFPGTVPRPLRRARAGLRQVTSALPRVDPDLDPQALDDDAFARLTRRALEPLRRPPPPRQQPPHPPPPGHPAPGRTRGPGRAPGAGRGAEGRAGGEHRPPQAAGPGRVRHLGRVAPLQRPLLPLRRRATPLQPAIPLPTARPARTGPAGPDARAALDWFRRAVPERTLYHWQRAAPRGPSPGTCESARAYRTGELRVEHWHQIAASGLPVAALCAVRWKRDREMERW